VTFVRAGIAADADAEMIPVDKKIVNRTRHIEFPSLKQPQVSCSVLIAAIVRMTHEFYDPLKKEIFLHCGWHLGPKKMPAMQARPLYIPL
jgi:hypothetical protein